MKIQQKYGLWRRAEKIVEHEGDSDTIRSRNSRNYTKEIGKKLDKRKIRGRIETI